MAEGEQDLVEFAHKKRYAALLEKLKTGNLNQSEITELAKYQGGDTASGCVTTHKEVAEAFEVSTRTVRNWVADGMPVNKDGTLNLVDILAWKTARAGGGKEASDKQKYEATLLKFKALMIEISYKKLMGEVVPVAEVDAGRVQRILIIKKALLGLPGRVAPQLVGLSMEEIKTRLTIRINEIITEFAKG